MPGLRRALWLVLALPLSTGCLSYLTLGSTQTTAPGKVALTAAGGKMVTGVGLAGSGLGTTPFLRGPTNLEGAFRVGIAPGFDWGLRLNLGDLGISTGFKVRPVNTPSFQLALAADVGVSLWAPLLNAVSSFVIDRGIGAFLYWVDGAVLTGFPLSSELLLFAGAKIKVTNYGVGDIASALGDTSGTTATISGTWVQPGVVLGVDYRIDDRTVVRPEIDVHVDTGTGALLLQGGVAVTLGG